MDEIIVGFSKPKAFFKPFSWLIRWVENTDYSHVYIRFYSQRYNRWLIYQASGQLVNFIGFDRFQTEEILLKEFTLQITSDSKQKMIQYCIDNIGKSYEVLGVIGLGFVLLARKFGYNIQNPLASGPNSEFCSKAVEMILNNFTNIKMDIDPDLVLPKDIYNTLEKIYGTN